MNITVRTTEFDIEANLDIRVEKNRVSVYWREWSWHVYGEVISEALDNSQKFIMTKFEQHEKANMLQHFLDTHNMMYKSRVTFVSDAEVKEIEKLMYIIDTIG